MRLSFYCVNSAFRSFKPHLLHRRYTRPPTIQLAAASTPQSNHPPRQQPAAPTAKQPTMPPKPLRPLPTDLPIHAFPTAAAFDTYLSAAHTTTPGVYVRLAKKASTTPSLSAAEAVETALCYGWIDGGGGGNYANSEPHSYLMRFTPRRPKSLWSQRNVDTVARLTEQGRMRPAGVAAVEAAKADGRWERAYAGPATMEVPADFAAAVKAVTAAERVFESLNRTGRYSVLWRVHTASPTARAGRVERLVQMLAEGQVPGVRAQPKTKAGKDGGGDAQKMGKKGAGVQKAKGKSRTTATAPKQSFAQKQIQGKAVMQQSRDNREPPRRAGLRPRS